MSEFEKLARCYAELFNEIEKISDILSQDTFNWLRSTTFAAFKLDFERISKQKLSGTEVADER